MASEDSRIGAGCTIWPFLLIVRTERIVTDHAMTLGKGSHMDRYRRMHGVSSIWPAALFQIALERGRPCCTQGFLP